MDANEFAWLHLVCKQNKCWLHHFRTSKAKQIILNFLLTNATVQNDKMHRLTVTLKKTIYWAITKQNNAGDTNKSTLQNKKVLHLLIYKVSNRSIDVYVWIVTQRREDTILYRDNNTKKQALPTDLLLWVNRQHTSCLSEWMNECTEEERCERWKPDLRSFPLQDCRNDSAFMFFRN